MMEHTTDRLFWTLTSVIVGALILTIGIKAFPNIASSALQPMSGFIQQADTQTKNVKKAGDDAIAKETEQSTGSTNSSTQSNTNSQPTDPDASAKANAVEASTLGFTITNNGDGTGTITGYDKSKGTSVNIPKYIKLNGTLLKITSIGQFAFRLVGLTSVTIPNSVTTIGTYAFSYNLLTSITIPNSVTSINDYTFSNNQLTSVNIPNHVTSIGQFAFAWNPSTSVNIPNTVTSIGLGAFDDNQLTVVNIPNSKLYYSLSSPFSTGDVFNAGVTLTNNPSSN